MKEYPNEQVQQWLENEEPKPFIKLVDLFLLRKNEITEKSKKDESNYKDIEVDIIFLAHGAITQPMIPASCLRPCSNIQDVLLYSPWNCLLNADAAYGIATGLMQPGHRSFICVSGSGCKNCYEGHWPRTLPPGWNSMNEAGPIPNIMVSTIIDKERDGAWTTFVNLTNHHGTPQRGRILVPFYLGGLAVTVPFFIVTCVMNLVLSLFRIKATVHLAACLGDGSTWFSREFLENQYSYTVDGTVMTVQPIRPIIHPDLYRNLQAMFD